MPKNKQYDFDYEWAGQAEPQQGVNIQAKHPFKKPAWGAPSTATSSSKSNVPSVTTIPSTDRAAMQELQKLHPWQKPDWATVDKSPKKTTDKEIVKDSIPMPMLKKTPANGKGESTTSSDNGKKKNGSTASEEADAEIAEMERRIAEAKAKKSELERKAAEEEERIKHTIEETQLEKARRIAKEREEARWRATLAERNARDKAKREEMAGKLAARDDTSWQQPVEASSVVVSTLPTQTPESEIVQQHRLDNTVLAPSHHPKNALVQSESVDHTSLQHNEVQLQEGERKEEEGEEYYDEVVEEEAPEDDKVSTPVASEVESLQRQIEALTRELQHMR